MTKSVLIIDDNEADRYLLKRRLQGLNYQGEYFEAEDGAKALEFLTNFDENLQRHGDSFPPEVIFLDINMPIMDGFEFLEKFTTLKQHDSRFTSVVVMMLTSSEHIRDIDRSRGYSAVKKFVIKGEYSDKTLLEFLNNPHD